MCSVEQPLMLGVHCMRQHGIKKRFTLCAQRRFDGGDVGFGVWPHAEQLYISIWPRINHSLMQMTLVWIMMMMRRSLIHHDSIDVDS